MIAHGESRGTACTGTPKAPLGATEKASARGCQSRRTSCFWQTRGQQCGSEIARPRPRRCNPSCEIKDGRKVTYPLKPVSMTTSTSSRWPSGSTSESRMTAFRSAVTVSVIIAVSTRHARRFDATRDAQFGQTNSPRWAPSPPVYPTLRWHYRPCRGEYQADLSARSPTICVTLSWSNQTGTPPSFK